MLGNGRLDPHAPNKLGTIDLRIDYLRPAIGEWFELRAEVLRCGSRVASTRMEFLGANGTLLSMGSAAYIVSQYYIFRSCSRDILLGYSPKWHNTR